MTLLCCEIFTNNHFDGFSFFFFFEVEASRVCSSSGFSLNSFCKRSRRQHGEHSQHGGDTFRRRSFKCGKTKLCASAVQSTSDRRTEPTPLKPCRTKRFGLTSAQPVLPNWGGGASASREQCIYLQQEKNKRQRTRTVPYITTYFYVCRA